MLEEVLARFGIEIDIGAITQALTSWQAMAAAAATVAVAIGVGFVNAIREATEATVELGVETARTADVLGLSTSAVQEWGFVASRAGRGVEEVADAMSTLQERARDALLDPQSDPAQQLRLLGVEARGANGELRDGEDLFLDVADGLAGMSSQTDRVGAAMTLFGDVGRDLLPVLQRGADGIEELRQRARDLGGVLSEDIVENSRRAVEAQADFDFAMQGIRARMAQDVLPAITAIVTGVADMIGFFNRLTRGTRPLRAILVALGIAIAHTAAMIGIALLPVFIQILPLVLLVAGSIAFLVLLFDDLLTLLEGGDSVIGRFLDEMFGIGSAQVAAVFLRRAWANFLNFLRETGLPILRTIARFLLNAFQQAIPAVRRFLARAIFLFRFFRIMVRQIREAARRLAQLALLPLRVIANFIPFRRIVQALGRAFRFMSELATQAFNAIRSALGPLEQVFVRVFNAILEAIQPVIDAIQRATNLVSGGAGGALQGALGFLGIDVGGARREAAAGVPRSLVRGDGARDAGAKVEQTNQITVNAANMSPAELERRITNGIRNANETALRTAERALTGIAPEPAGA